MSFDPVIHLNGDIQAFEKIYWNRKKRIQILFIREPQKSSSTSGPKTKRGRDGPLIKNSFFDALKTKKGVPMTTKLGGFP